MSHELDILSAAARLGVHPNTIRRYIASGVLPAARVGGGRYRLNVEDVDALMRPVPSAKSA